MVRVTEDGKPRRPRWVYAEGEEPDYRFTLANERTFLAWIRTALALMAAGVAVDSVDLRFGAAVERGLAAALVVLGLMCAVLAWLRWAFAERAMRLDRPLPGSVASMVLATGLLLIGVAVLLLSLAA